MKKKFISGALEDTRSSDEKAKDFKVEELYTFANDDSIWDVDYLDWYNSPETKEYLSAIETNDQNGSGSCMAQSGSLIGALDNFEEEGIFTPMSATPVYASRRNKPDAGMAFDDLGNIITSSGLLPKALCKSDGLTDEQMSDLSGLPPSFLTIAKIYKEKSYMWATCNDIDVIGNILQLGHPAVLGVKFGTGEWSREKPEITQQSTPYAHGISLLPRATFRYNGEKAIFLQDSWGISSGIKGRRIITESWFNTRTFACIYFENLSNLDIFNKSQDKPQFIFTTDLEMNQQGNDIAMLQRCLGYIKDSQGYLFPLTQSPTGYYGGVTRSAVKRYQALRNIAQTGTVGPLTRAALNKEFN